MPSLGKIRYRCPPTVRWERKRRSPISRFESPSAASCAIWSSWVVSRSRASGVRWPIRLARRSELLTCAFAPPRRAERVEAFDALAKRCPCVSRAPLSAQPAPEREQRPALPGTGRAFKSSPSAADEESLAPHRRRPTAASRRPTRPAGMAIHSARRRPRARHDVDELVGVPAANARLRPGRAAPTSA